MVTVLFMSSHPIDLTRRCLESLSAAWLSAGLSHDDLTVLIGYHDETRKTHLLALFEQPHLKRLKEQTRLIEIDRSLPVPLARNRLLETRKFRTSIQVESDWIFFIDDDVELPKDYFLHFEAARSAWPQAQIFGGPNITPPNQTGLAKYSGALYGSRLNFICRDRYADGPEGIRLNANDFILCNLLVQAQLEPQFSAHLPFGEELGLIENLIEKGACCVYSPRLRLYHVRRETTEQILEQMERYGLGRGLLLMDRSSRNGIADVFLLAVVIFVCLILLPLIALFTLSLAMQSVKNSRDSSWPNRIRLFCLLPWFYFIGLAKGVLKRTPQLSKKVTPYGHAASVSTSTATRN